MNHSEIVSLIPWYVNSTLPDPERQAVESHVRQCPECARRVEEFRRVAAAERQLSESLPGPSPSLLKRTLAAIETIEQTKEESGWSGFWRKAAGWWPATPFPARLVIAAQVMALALLLVLRPGGEKFTTLSGPSDRHARIQIQFQPGVTEEQIRTIVLELDGAIVDGPSRLGLYTVQLPHKKTQEAEIRAALDKLRANPTLVRIAEQKL